MKAILIDGTEIKCETFAGQEYGVFLYKDEAREEKAGFVPMHKLHTIAPDDYEAEDTTKQAGPIGLE